MTDDKKDMIPVTDWGKLIHAFGKDGVPVPFVKEIFLLESEVAGTGFVEDIEAKTRSLQPGSLLPFQREPTNKYDAKAIQILNEKQERIGYVPRADNEVVSRLMDAGKLIYGKVKGKRDVEELIHYKNAKHPSPVWLHIIIEIYMRDL